MLRSAILLFALAFVGWGLAQAVLDTGVNESVDEFTGQRSCRHLVIHSPSDVTGMMLSRSYPSSLETLVSIIRAADSLTETTFNMFGRLSGDRVYIRFPSSDEVLEFVPFEVSVTSEGRSTYEAAYIYSDALALAIMSSPTDLRVRFAGSDGNRDLTVRHDVVVALAQGFGQKCLY